MNKLTLQAPMPGALPETMQKPPVPKPVQGPPAPAGTPRTAAPVQDQVRGTAEDAVQAGAGDSKTESEKGKTTESASGSRASGPETGLTAADLEQIAARLAGGAAPLAARSDLVELHSRITRMFATLNEGLSDMHSRKAAADREILSSRIDMLEAAVNRMEGALRIEFEPLLKTALDEALAKQAPPRRRGLSRALLLGLALALGLGLGSFYHQPLRDTAAMLAAELQGPASRTPENSGQ